jgi:uncharacterized protein
MDNSLKPVRKVISLTITQSCNLACTYCYEGFKSKNEMQLDTALSIIERYLNNPTDDYDECEIDLFGGEPFLNFTLIKKMCETVWSRQWKKPYLFFSTTNGTLVHGEIKTWLQKNKNRFFLGLSLDGTRSMHDRNRSNSFSSIDIPFFRETWPEEGVKMTISKETLPDLAEGVIFLHSLGFEVHNNLAYGIDWTDNTNLQILNRELRKLIEYYLDHPEITPCSLLNMKIAYQGHTEKKWCGVGVEMAVYDYDGKKYPCHTFLPLSIGRKKAEASLAIDFSNIQLLIDPKCKECMLYNLCPTCYGSNYSETGNVAIRNMEQCRITKIRALASSYFEAKKLLRNQESQSIQNDQSRLIDAIISIQESISIE